LQSLTLLNDVTSVEAASALAQRIEREGGSDNVRDRASFGFRLCTCRMPTTSELDAIVTAYENYLMTFHRDNAAAEKIAVGAHVEEKQPEFAAWFLVSQALLNLDETLSKE
jgi:hypothetical protein